MGIQVSNDPGQQNRGDGQGAQVTPRPPQTTDTSSLEQLIERAQSHQHCKQAVATVQSICTMIRYGGAEVNSLLKGPGAFALFGLATTSPMGADIAAAIFSAIDGLYPANIKSAVLDRFATYVASHCEGKPADIASHELTRLTLKTIQDNAPELILDFLAAGQFTAPVASALRAVAIGRLSPARQASAIERIQDTESTMAKDLADCLSDQCPVQPVLRNALHKIGNVQLYMACDSAHPQACSREPAYRAMAAWTTAFCTNQEQVNRAVSFLGRQTPADLATWMRALVPSTRPGVFEPKHCGAKALALHLKNFAGLDPEIFKPLVEALAWHTDASVRDSCAESCRSISLGWRLRLNLIMARLWHLVDGKSSIYEI